MSSLTTVFRLKFAVLITGVKIYVPCKFQLVQLPRYSKKRLICTVTGQIPNYLER